MHHFKNKYDGFWPLKTPLSHIWILLDCCGKEPHHLKGITNKAQVIAYKS